MSNAANRQCANAGCKNVGKHLCSGCGEEIYCSKECQKAHWVAHKQACNSAVKPEATAFMKNFDSLSVKQLKNIMKAKAATFENKKKQIVLAKLESIAEKPDLVKFVQEYVEMAEVEGLLSVSTAAEASSGSSSSSSSSRSGDKQGSTSGKSKKATPQPPLPSPDQLRQQAKMMREQPNMVRKANAMFQNMTDAQIRQYADQIELAASDPAMLQEMARMSQMSPKERDGLQHIQEGLAGSKPMDSAWMDTTIGMLKKNPQIFKGMVKGKGAMLGGMTDEQTSSFIDTISAMDAGTLKLILRAMIFLGSLYQPAVQLYNTVDSYTLGCARYLLLFVVMIVLYYVSMVVFAVLKVVFAGLYALFVYLRGLYAGSGNAGAVLPDAVETVYSAATTAVGSDGASLASKVLSEGVQAAGATAVAGVAGAAAGVAGGAHKAASTPATDAEDDKYDF